ncbi:hypothetical protein Taro_006863 [Colocasia esculenta]|uniref:Uncharacterized protein n=1 Tax=Colocasia esculenta TaxID=4460 RepID=A0A843TTW8_COLES|nr:hypothetical protein [Colocasia esculenta]
MERHKPIPQPFFPSYNRTPKYLGCLNTLHPNTMDEFRTCRGRVEELLVAEELWNDHKKLIFFPVASAATCTDSHLEVNQRCRPCERDGLIGHVLSLVTTAHPSRSERDEHTVATSLPDLTAPSRSSHPLIAFFSGPVATLTGDRRDLTFGSDRPVAFFICTRRDLRILH